MKQKTVYLLLAAIICFHVVNNLIILKIDNIPFIYDLFNNYQHSISNYNLILKSPIQVFNFGNPELSFHYPPLLYWMTLPFFLLFGTGEDVAVMANMIFFAVLILATYGIGKELHDEKVGLLAAFTVSMFPAIFGYSRVYTVDFLQASLVTLTIYLLIKTEYFSNKKFSILLGFGLGIGMLGKQTCLIYVGVPLLFYLLISIKNKTGFCVKNMLFSGLIAIVLSFPWYYSHFKNISYYVSSNPYFKFTVKDIFLYAYSIYKYQLFPFYAIIFLFSLIMYVLFLKNKLKFLVLVWLLTPIVFHTIFFEFKFARYILPSLPAVSIIIAVSIISLKKIKIKSLKRLAPYLPFLIIGLGVIQFFMLCYSSIEPIKSIPELHERFEEKGIIKPGILSFDTRDVVKDFINIKNKDLFIVEMADTPFIDMIEHEFYLQGFEFKVYSPYKTLDIGLQPGVIPENYDFTKIFDEANIILTNDKGYFGSEDIPIDERIKKRFNKAYFQTFEKRIDEFVLIKKVPTNLRYEDSSILLYARKGLL
ncbi:MAG: glycosyltransferase family 39 protein [Candidatus Omnitrophota bacterium]|nr:glycosyltransferase family 39 protein [Candidatus Omnitrophota bacterium]